MPDDRGRASGRLARRAIAVSVAAALTSTVLAAAGALSLPGAVLLFAAAQLPGAAVIPLAVLAGWLVVAAAAARRGFRWAPRR